MATTRRVTTAAGPVDAVVAVPGSKSIANRALVIAALAEGDSELTNVPDGDDTVALVGALGRLGVVVSVDSGRAVVAGRAGRVIGGTAAEPVRVDARLAGTTSRFVTALAALARGPVIVDGAPPLRVRPIGPLHDALGQLGVRIDTPKGAGRLPATIGGGLTTGGTVTLPGHVSSQFLSALMMIGPLLDGGLVVELTSPLVSVPYVALTATVMHDFGVDGVEIGADRIVVPAGTYRGRHYAVEPDASSASYPLAVAAVVGGRVRVPGLTLASPQGDVAFAEMLAAMGCRLAPAGPDLVVERDPSAPLRGIDVDLADTSDLVPTLAAVAATATTPTRITGVGFIRSKESDRLGDLATELGRLGARVTVEEDGLLIEPAALRGATLRTHHDHRLAMAFGVVGAAVPGVVVEDPEVVSKSWPDYWAARDRLVAADAGRGARRPGVAAFDVDGTLTTTDCVVPFLRLVAGTRQLVGGVARRGRTALAALLRRDRDRLKEVSVEAALTDRSIAQIENLGQWFAGTFVRDHLRPDALARLRWHQERGHAVVLVSASFGAYLRPLAAWLSTPGASVDALATELVERDGRATGELLGGNCRGAEKRTRLLAWLDQHHGGRDAVELWAYGDSAGDDELLAAADHAVRVTGAALPDVEDPGR